MNRAPSPFAIQNAYGAREEPWHWQRYRRGVTVHKSMMGAMVGFVPFALWCGDPLMSALAFLLPPLLCFWSYSYAWCAECPFCERRIATGARQNTFFPLFVGAFPRACTHCAAPVGATTYKPPPPPKPRLRTKRCARRIADDVLSSLD